MYLNMKRWINVEHQHFSFVSCMWFALCSIVFSHVSRAGTRSNIVCFVVFFAGSRESQFFATAEAGLVGTARGEPGMFFVVFVYPCVLAENKREQWEQWHLFCVVTYLLLFFFHPCTNDSCLFCFVLYFRNIKFVHIW